VIRIALHGATGRMGRAIVQVIEETDGASLVDAFSRADDPAVGSDAGLIAQVGSLGVPVRTLGAGASIEADVVIDFSTPAATHDIAGRCFALGLPLVSGTTGLDAETLAAIDALAATTPVVFAPNMSVGVTVLFHLAAVATKLLGPDFDPEIVEMHHRHKIDAPSGTAARLASVVAEARGLDPEASVVHGRSGQVGARRADEIGVMTLRGGGVIGEHTLVLASASERVELTHRAQDRSIFARGAVRAATWIVGQPAGRYDMADVLGIARGAGG
jgi:4-hydroxy-tetrahydrodipicolinate reductase